MIRPTSNVGLISKIVGKSLDTLPDRTVFLLLEAEDNSEKKIIGLAAVFMFDNFLAIADVEILGKYKQHKELCITLCEELIQHIKNIGFGKVIALVPDYRKEVMGFFQRGGFKREGVLKNSCVSNGEVFHQTILGVELWV